MGETESVNLDAIQHDEHERGGSFFLEQDGRRVAQMTYVNATSSVIVIDHTEVNRELSGRGIGRKLLNALVVWARDLDRKVRVTCPYARAQFAKDPTIQDVLARPIRNGEPGTSGAT